MNCSFLTEDEIAKFMFVSKTRTLVRERVTEISDWKVHSIQKVAFARFVVHLRPK